MTALIDEKLARLQRIISGLPGAAVAFSGGVDSALLLKVAADTLGDQVLAVTFRSAVNPPGEVDEAVRFSAAVRVKHLVVDIDPLQDEAFAANTPQRCYHCKKKIMGLMFNLAREHGYAHVLDGMNADDTDDYRPGIRAARELGVKSPLYDAGINKAEIRSLSRKLGLFTADKPAAACLASRFPYGTRITAGALQRVAGAEVFLHRQGFTRVRVRSHGNLARIEVPGGEIAGLLANATEIAAQLKAFGFTYVAVDLQGYRTGSMNETLDAPCLNKTSP